MRQIKALFKLNSTKIKINLKIEYHLSGAMTPNITALSILPLSITTFSIMTLSIMTLSITTLNIKGLFVTLSIQHKRHSA